MRISAARVADEMTTDVVVAAPGDDLMVVVRRLVDEELSGVLVTDEQGDLVGVLTERDCIQMAIQAGYFDETGGSVGAYMSTEIETVHSQDSLMDVASRFASSKHRRFPVVDDGVLKGIISRRDVLRALTRETWFRQPGDHS